MARLPGDGRDARTRRRATAQTCDRAVGHAASPLIAVP